LHGIIKRGETISLERVRGLIDQASESSSAVPEVTVEVTPLKNYDELLSAEEVAA
jgi:hypothetical protein